MANDLSSDPAYSSNSTSGSSGANGATSGNGSDAAAARQQRFERVVSGAHEAVDSAAESIAQAAEALRDKANRLGEMEKEYAESCRASVREHPLSYLAGALLLGVLIGLQFSGTAADPAMALHEGQLVAGGRLAQALSSQLAGDPPAGGAPVAVQLSFVDKGGSYCRTFSTAALSGLACQQAGQWAVQTLVTAEQVPGGVMRQATTALPPAVLEAVDQRIAGAALDAGRERQARDSGWRR